MSRTLLPFVLDKLTSPGNQKKKLSHNHTSEVLRDHLLLLSLGALSDPSFFSVDRIKMPIMLFLSCTEGGYSGQKRNYKSRLQSKRSEKAMMGYMIGVRIYLNTARKEFFDGKMQDKMSMNTNFILRLSTPYPRGVYFSD